MMKHAARFVLLACLVAASGCITTTKTLGEYGLAQSAYQSGAVGGFSIADALEIERDHIVKGGLYVLVEHQRTGKTYKIAFAEGGPESPFYVKLPPGTYQFVEGETKGALPGRHDYSWSGPPVQFEVERGRVQCLGTIRFEKGEESSETIALETTLGDKVSGDWKVADSCDELTEQFHERHPELNRLDIGEKLAETK
jgi:hypothetical protein